MLVRNCIDLASPHVDRLKARIVFTWFVIIILTGAIFPVSALPTPRPQVKKFADQMPEGDGKSLIVEKCQLCHTLERVVISHRSRNDWQAVIDLMIEQGASLTDNESKSVVNYLATNYPPKTAASVSPEGPLPPVAAPPSMIFDPDQANFTAPPDSLGLPKGVTMAIISGDPTKSGLFSVLIAFLADQIIAPHWVSSDLDYVVLRGSYELGNGAQFDSGKLKLVSSGQVVHVPAQSQQFGQVKGTTVMLLYGLGPLSIQWEQ